MAKTWSEMGEERGVLKGQRRILLRQLQRRFSTVSETARQRLEAWPAEKLDELADALFTAQSLKELGLED